MKQVIILTGLVAGVLDALGAIITFLIRGGKNPVKIFNFIASGVLGDAGLKGGNGMAMAGLLFHLIIATIWTLLFFLVYPKIKSINWVTSGIAYGVVVWLGMNLIVVPLSRTPPLPFTFSGIVVGIIVLILCIGLPIAYSARKYFK